MNDYIWLPRLALSDELWRNNGALLRVYMYLVKQSENGIANTSTAQICKATGLTERQARDALTELERSNRTSSKRSNKGSNITLCEIGGCSILTSSKRSNRTSSKRSNKKITIFSPPTREEAQAYIDKMGFHWGDADLFIDFNAQKNWRLSDGKPMQDWKAAMRNWENRWKQKYKNGELKTNTEDKYSARRGTDVGNLTEADFGGAF